MSILAWIEDQRKLKLLNAPKYNHPTIDGSKGLWTRCDHCGVILYIKHLKENRRVCFGCGYHLQMNSQERIDHLIDIGTWRCLNETLSPCDPLEFWDQKAYTERLKESQERTGLQDAIQTGTGMLYNIPVALGVMDFYFMGGSMGSVVGEKITRLIEYATQEGLTLILVCASGGARMQEGVLSLMQMAKISAALQIYQSCANLLYISILTSPTTGGVTASFAMLGDLIFAEPKALIGFAGRRVIEQTLQEQLPDDFQTSEYLLHHGLLDLIIPRSFLKSALFEMITLYKDAPLKRSGTIPYGIQQNLNFITEEKIRRTWTNWRQVIKNDFKYDKQYLEKISSSNKNKKTDIIVSESFYREILTSFQALVGFFSLPILFTPAPLPANEQNFKNQTTVSETIIKNKLFTDDNFYKFISKSQKVNTQKNSNKLNLEFTETTFTNKDEEFISSEENLAKFSSEEISHTILKMNSEMIEWRILYSTQDKNAKKKFLKTFINGKHKRFFYKSLI